MSSRPDWVTESQDKLHRKTLSRKTNKQKTITQVGETVQQVKALDPKLPHICSNTNKNLHLNKTVSNKKVTRNNLL